MAAEDVNHSSVPEPQSRESSKEGDQPSPVSVLEASFDDDEVSSSSECFESVSADLQGSQSINACSFIDTFMHYNIFISLKLLWCNCN